MSKKPLPEYTSRSVKEWDTLDHIRHRSEMWIGGTPLSQHFQFFKELIDNSGDEASVAGDQLSTIRVTIIRMNSAPYYQAIISDNGRGIPLDSLRTLLFVPLSGAKGSDTEVARKNLTNAYNASSGIFGVGAKAIAALSKRECGLSSRKEGTTVGVMKDLKVIRDERTKKRASQGTTVFFETDPEYTGQHKEFLEEGGIKRLIELCDFQTAILPNTEIIIEESTKRVSEKLIMETDPVELKNILDQWPTTKVVHKTDPEKVTMETLVRRNARLGPKTEIAFSTWLNSNDKPMYDIRLMFPDIDAFRTDGIIGAVNRIPINTYNSSHLKTFISMVKKEVAKYIEDKDIKAYFHRLYKMPLYGFIAVWWPGARFKGQLKTDFYNEDFEKAFEHSLRPRFKELGEKFWKDVYNYLASHLEASFNQYYNRGVVKSGLKGLSGRLKDFDNYKACASTDPRECELFLTEGASAAGSASQARDSAYQAVFRLKGKSLNSVRASSAQQRNNETIRELVKVVGVPIGSGDDLSGLNFHRINILTDADADGKHITALMVMILNMMSPKLLTEGHVIIPNPPLYRMKAGKLIQYIHNEASMIKTKARNIYPEILDIGVAEKNNHKKIDWLSAQEEDEYGYSPYFLVCTLIIQIGEILEKYARRLTISPWILEQMLYIHRQLSKKVPDTENIAKILGYEQVSYKKETNSLICSVTEGADIDIPLNGMVRIIRACILPEYMRLRWSEVDLIINTRHSKTYNNNEVSPYQLYQVFKQIDSSFAVTRFKGLGEMDPQVLWDAVLNPEKRRSFIIRDIGDVDLMYSLMDNDPTERKKMLTSGE